MHRQPLLDLLAEYETRHRTEADLIARFRGFVATQERCFQRDLWAGHVTGSAWLVNAARDAVLLTHHRKLGRWLQLGGHSDGNPDALAVAIAEAEEESGLAVQPLAPFAFDLDIHEIPARKQDPAHFHFDVRFVLQVVGKETFRVSAESLDLAWVPIERLSEYTDERSMLRMAEKWRAGGWQRQAFR
jgi:8-oxo-dGTP pyrophosphatase MutT (NUDIX family)